MYSGPSSTRINMEIKLSDKTSAVGKEISLQNAWTSFSSLEPPPLIWLKKPQDIYPLSRSKFNNEEVICLFTKSKENLEELPTKNRLPDAYNTRKKFVYKNVMEDISQCNVRKAYKCIFCNEDFKYKKPFILHMRKHTVLNTSQKKIKTIPTIYISDTFFNDNVEPQEISLRDPLEGIDGHVSENFNELPGHRYADPRVLNKKLKPKPKGKLRLNDPKIRRKGKMKQYNCVICFYTSNNRKIYRRHLTKHKLSIMNIKPREVDLINENIFQCKMCDFNTEFIYVLKKHLRNHKRSKNKAGEKGLAKTSVETYKKDFEINKYFCCGHCNFTTKYKMYLEFHMSKHSPGDGLEAMESGYLEKQNLSEKKGAEVKLEPKGCASNLESYIERPSNLSYTEFKDCDFVGTNNTSPKYQEPVQSEIRVNIFKCGICDFVTCYNKNINQHMKEHKESMDQAKSRKKHIPLNILKCTCCDFRTKYIKYLDLHMSKHKEITEIQNYVTREGQIKVFTQEDKNAITKSIFNASFQQKVSKNVNFKDSSDTFGCAERYAGEDTLWTCNDVCLESQTIFKNMESCSLKANLAEHCDGQIVSNSEINGGMYRIPESVLKSIPHDHSENSDSESLLVGYSAEQDKHFKCDECNFSTNFMNYLELHLKKHNNLPEVLTNSLISKIQFETEVYQTVEGRSENASVKNSNHTGSVTDHSYCLTDKDSLFFDSEIYAQAYKNQETCSNAESCSSITNLECIQINTDAESNCVSKFRENSAVDQDKNFKCDKCDFATNFMRYLELHVEKHKEICEKAMKSSEISNVKNSDVLSSKDRLNSKVYEDQTCFSYNESCSSTTDVQIIQVSKSNGALFATKTISKNASNANKGGKSKENLLVDQDKHFKCDECDFSTNFLRYFNLHMEKHTNLSDLFTNNTICSNLRSETEVGRKLLKSISNARTIIDTDHSYNFTDEQNTKIASTEKSENLSSSIENCSVTNLAENPHIEMIWESATDNVFENISESEIEIICDNPVDIANDNTFSRRQEDLKVDGEKNFKCYECDFSTNFMIYLDLHMEKHTNLSDLFTNNTICSNLQSETEVGRNLLKNINNAQTIIDTDNSYNFIDEQNTKIVSTEKSENLSSSIENCSVDKSQTILEKVERCNSVTNLAENPHIEMIWESATNNVFENISESEIEIICDNPVDIANDDTFSRRYANLAVDGGKHFKCDKCNFATNFRTYMKLHMEKHNNLPTSEPADHINSKKDNFLEYLESTNEMKNSNQVSSTKDLVCYGDKIRLFSNNKECSGDYGETVSKFVKSCDSAENFVEDLAIHIVSDVFCNLTDSGVIISDYRAAETPEVNEGQNEYAAGSDFDTKFLKYKIEKSCNSNSAAECDLLYYSDNFSTKEEIDICENPLLNKNSCKILESEYKAYVCRSLGELNDFDTCNSEFNKFQKVQNLVILQKDTAFQCKYCSFETNFEHFIVLHESKHNENCISTTMSTNKNNFDKCEIQRSGELVKGPDKTQRKPVTVQDHRLNLNSNNCETELLKMYPNVDTKTERFRCRYCKFKTKYKKYVTLHKKKHKRRWRKLRPYKCGKCYFSTHFNAFFQAHLEKHI